MQKHKKTAEYTVYKRGDDRYAVKDKYHKPVNGEAKVAILKQEGLLKQPVSKPAEPEAAAEGDTDGETAAE